MSNQTNHCGMKQTSVYYLNSKNSFFFFEAASFFVTSPILHSLSSHRINSSHSLTVYYYCSNYKFCLQCFPKMFCFSTFITFDFFYINTLNELVFIGRSYDKGILLLMFYLITNCSRLVFHRYPGCCCIHLIKIIIM